MRCWLKQQCGAWKVIQPGKETSPEGRWLIKSTMKRRLCRSKNSQQDANQSETSGMNKDERLELHFKNITLWTDFTCNNLSERKNGFIYLLLSSVRTKWFFCFVFLSWHPKYNLRIKRGWISLLVFQTNFVFCTNWSWCSKAAEPVHHSTVSQNKGSFFFFLKSWMLS